MTIRETSAEAFRIITDNGLLSSRRREVYAALYRNGPATASELIPFVTDGTAPNQIRARLNEMRELGVAAEKGKRKCRVTGLTVIEWDVTSRLPKTPEREVSICPTCGHKQIIAN